MSDSFETASELDLIAIKLEKETRDTLLVGELRNIRQQLIPLLERLPITESEALTIITYTSNQLIAIRKEIRKK